MKLLVDSDVVIDGLRGVGDANRVLNRLAGDELVISTITLAEVPDGAQRGPDNESIAAEVWAFLDGFEILPVTVSIAEIFANRRSQLRRFGTMIPDMGLLIAATAIAHDLTLLTRNRRHFERVPGPLLYDDGQRSLGTTPSE